MIRYDIKHFLDVFQGGGQIHVGLFFAPVYLTGQFGQNRSPNHHRPHIFAVEFDRPTRVRNRFLGLIGNQIQLGPQRMGQRIVWLQFDGGIKDIDGFALYRLVELVSHSKQTCCRNNMVFNIFRFRVEPLFQIR